MSACRNRGKWLSASPSASSFRSSESAGEFNRTFVNRAGITRILLDASIPGLLPDSTGRRSQLLSRPDLDWQQVLRTITGNGLARPLTRFFESPDVSALTPAFVQDAIRNASVAESVKLLEVQKTLRLIATCLEEAGAEAVLLKGAALVVQSLSDGEAIPCKTPGDIDLYIDPDKANVIRGETARKRIRRTCRRYREPSPSFAQERNHPRRDSCANSTPSSGACPRKRC